MFRRKLRWAALAAAAGMVCGASGNTYTWTHFGSNTHWDNCSNWTGAAPGCYPATGSDDAIISYTSGGYDVQLLTKTIDDLTITGSVDFTAQTGTPTLTADTVTISGGASTTTTGTLATGCHIVTN
jgi:hypothetical protein